MKKTSESLASV